MATFQEFRASFSIGEVSGTITVSAQSFEAAIKNIDKVINGRGDWSIIVDEQGNEQFNDNIETHIDTWANL